MDAAIHHPFGSQAAVPDDGAALSFAYQTNAGVSLVEDGMLQIDMT